MCYAPFPRPACRASCLAALAAGTLALAAPTQGAQIGFGDFSGYTITQSDAGAPPTVSIGGGSITLTNVGSGEARSIFAKTPQAIGTFTAKFTYQATNIGFNFNSYQGMTFTIQTAPAGTAAVGTNTGLGYSGMPSSLGLAITLLNQGTPVTGATLAKNGSIPTPTDVTGLNAYDGHPIDVTVSYNGTLVHQGLKDTVTSAAWETDYFLSPPLATQLASSTAYVGFTAGTVAGANQTISNFSFVNSVPEPSAALAAAGPAVVLLARRRRQRR